MSDDDEAVDQVKANLPKINRLKCSDNSDKSEKAKIKNISIFYSRFCQSLIAT